MRQRMGIIIAISGIVLLIKPQFDIDQISMNINYAVANYWPLFLVFLGLIFMMPKKKKRGK